MTSNYETQRCKNKFVQSKCRILDALYNLRARKKGKKTSVVQANSYNGSVSHYHELVRRVWPVNKTGNKTEFAGYCKGLHKDLFFTKGLVNIFLARYRVKRF